MFLAMGQDVWVILIKLADRLHNMRTLSYQPVSKQREIAQETLEIFAPLAHRLGIYRIKWEIEDLALRYLEPDTYYSLVEQIAKKRREREDYINLVISRLQEKLDEAGIKAEISGRPKNFYSIYQKTVGQGKSLGEIYDLTAVRVIVDYDQRLLCHPGDHAHHVEADPGALQGLHRHAQAEHVPVAAHHPGRAFRGALRVADPHPRDAPHCRVRYRRPLEVQGGRAYHRLPVRREVGLAAPDPGSAA